MELIKQVNKNGIAHPFAGVSTKYNNGMAMVSFLKNGNGNISKEARQANGVIFENGNSNPKLLHYSFEKCYDTRDDLYTFKPGEKYDVGLYFEGSIIKLFWYKETWNVSTSRGIDAKTNFWISEKSFFELFVECVEKSYSCNYQFFLDSLEKNSFYTFLMCHPENDNNCKDSLPMAYCLNKVTPEYDSNQDIVNLNEFLPEEDNLTVKKDIDKQELDNFIIRHKRQTGIKRTPCGAPSGFVAIETEDDFIGLAQ